MGSQGIDPLSAEVYKQACEDLRFYGDMRFKQLTLWSVGMGFVLNVLYGKEAAAQLPVRQRGMWFVAAFFWTAVIWVMEVRSSVHGVHRMEFKNRLEKRGSPAKWTLLNATNSIALLYAGSCLIWAVQLVDSWGTRVVSIYVVAFVFVLLFAFTLREYWDMLSHAIDKWRF